jgi:hypothetical protein
LKSFVHIAKEEDSQSHSDIFRFSYCIHLKMLIRTPPFELILTCNRLLQVPQEFSYSFFSVPSSHHNSCDLSVNSSSSREESIPLVTVVTPSSTFIIPNIIFIDKSVMKSFYYRVVYGSMKLRFSCFKNRINRSPSH